MWCTESSRSEEKLWSDSTVLETEITDCASPDRPFLIRPSEVAHGEHPCRFQKFHKSLLKYSVVKPTCQSKACGGGQLFLRYPKKDALMNLKDEKNENVHRLRNVQSSAQRWTDRSSKVGTQANQTRSLWWWWRKRCRRRKDLSYLSFQ